MEEGMTIRQEEGIEQAMTANEVRAQVNRIQEIMKAVMKKDVHFGVIPGTDKPTLFKPGAEKIFATFHIAVDPVVESETRLPDEYTVRIKAVATCNGRELGSAMGEASSNEEKYKWRRALCQEEYDEAPEDMRRMAFKRYQGKVSRIPQVRVNVADISNTILKMGVKRAEIALCLQVTSASDVFAQDIEDLPEGILGEDGKPGVIMPTRKSDQPDVPPPDAAKGEPAGASDGEQTISGVIGPVTRKQGKSAKGDYVKCGICVTTATGDVWINTFNTDLADAADAAKGQKGDFVVKKGRYGLDLIELVMPKEKEKTDGLPF